MNPVSEVTAAKREAASKRRAEATPAPKVINLTPQQEADRHERLAKMRAEGKASRMSALRAKDRNSLSSEELVEVFAADAWDLMEILEDAVDGCPCGFRAEEMIQRGNYDGPIDLLKDAFARLLWFAHFFGDFLPHPVPERAVELLKVLHPSFPACFEQEEDDEQEVAD